MAGIFFISFAVSMFHIPNHLLLGVKHNLLSFNDLLPPFGTSSILFHIAGRTLAYVYLDDTKNGDRVLTFLESKAYSVPFYSSSAPQHDFSSLSIAPCNPDSPHFSPQFKCLAVGYLANRLLLFSFPALQGSQSQSPSQWHFKKYSRSISPKNASMRRR